jgi:hypothetical protein
MGLLVETQINELMKEKELKEKEILDEMWKIETEERKIDDLNYEKNRQKKKIAVRKDDKRVNGKMEEEVTVQDIHTVNLWKKRMQDKKLETGNLGKELTAINNTQKILNKWMGQEREVAVVKEEEQEEVENLAFDIHNPPISVIFDLCVNRPIQMQATLTNKVLLELLFDRYKLFNVLKYFKTVFLTERGDIADTLAENLYDFNSN